MNWSDERNELASALALAQGQIKAAKKGNTAGGGSFKYQYSSLEDIWDVARKPLSDNGLAVIQVPTNDTNGFFLETIVLHASGQWVSSGPMRLPVDTSRMKEIQAMGSAITYARRYQLGAMVGVSVSTEDDDGAASGNVPQDAHPKPKPKSNKPKAPNGELEKFFARTRIELDLIDDQAKAILKELGHSVFKADKAEAYFDALDDQLNDSVTTETALLVLVNRETGGYYNHLNHMRNAIAKIGPGFGFPPKRDEIVQWQTVLAMLVDHAQANQAVTPDEVDETQWAPATDGIINS